MDQSTQQNAAMVEQTSAAARNLSGEVAALSDQAGSSQARLTIEIGKTQAVVSAGIHDGAHVCMVGGRGQHRPAGARGPVGHPIPGSRSRGVAERSTEGHARSPPSSA